MDRVIIQKPGVEVIPGLKLRCLCIGHTDSVTLVTWSPAGDRLASFSRDKTVRVWDPETGNCRSTVPVKGFDLRLMSLPNDVSGIQTSGKNLIIVATVNNVLHFRIFDADGKVVVDTDEKRLTELAPQIEDLREQPKSLWPSHELAPQIEDLREQLKSLWPPHELTCSDKERVITAVTSIVGHIPGGDGASNVGCLPIIAQLKRREVGGAEESDIKHKLMRLLANPSLLERREVGWAGASEIWHRPASILLSYSRDPSWIGVSFAAAPGRKIFATGLGATIYISDTTMKDYPLHVIEGHTKSVASVSFAADGRLMASKSEDDTVRFWDCSSWKEVARFDEPGEARRLSMAFHPSAPVLATCDHATHTIRVWDVDIDTLLRTGSAQEVVRYTSAKIVLVGESNVGKSCLALRLAEGRYPKDHEQGTTHGMRFWPMDAEKLHPLARPPADQRRDIVLWDMGGQDEYRLVHQLFLYDTTLALILIDPTRGRVAHDEAREWNKRLVKQLEERNATRLLVGAKMDRASKLVNRAAIDELCRECGFHVYLEVSAKTSRNVDKLRQTIAASLDWDRLAKTSRPELFQRIRDHVEERRKLGEAGRTPRRHQRRDQGGSLEDLRGDRRRGRR